MSNKSQFESFSRKSTFFYSLFYAANHAADHDADHLSLQRATSRLIFVPGHIRPVQKVAPWRPSYGFS